MSDTKPRPVKLRADKHDEIQQLAEELTQERGSDTSIPDVIYEAVKFYKENRESK